MNKAKEDWVEEQCTEIEDCLTINSSKRAYQVVKELTKPILREEVETAVRSSKNGKVAGNDNIPAELLKKGGEAVIERKETYNKVRTIEPSVALTMRAK